MPCTFAILRTIAVLNVLAPFDAVELKEKFDDVSRVNQIDKCKPYSFLSSHVLRQVKVVEPPLKLLVHYVKQGLLMKFNWHVFDHQSCLLDFVWVLKNSINADILDPSICSLEIPWFALVELFLLQQVVDIHLSKPLNEPYVPMVIEVWNITLVT